MIFKIINLIFYIINIFDKNYNTIFDVVQNTLVVVHMFDKLHFEGVVV